MCGFGQIPLMGFIPEWGGPPGGKGEIIPQKTGISVPRNSPGGRVWGCHKGGPFFGGEGPGEKPPGLASGEGP